MDTKILMKEVYQKAKTGQFADVLELIKGVDVLREVALNILICASNACYNSQKESFNINNVEVNNLLNYIVCSIDTLDESQLVPFLRAIFHIIKYMCEKELFEDLTKVEFIIIPIFLNKCSIKSTKEAGRVYQAMVNTLCNSIFRLAETKKTIHNKYLLWLIKIIFKANIQINTIKDTLSIAHKFLSIIQDLKFQNNELCKFYLIVLDCLASDCKNNEDCKDNIKLLIHIFSIIISDMIKSKEFQIIEMFLVNIESQIKILNFTWQGLLQSHLIFKAVTAMFPSCAGEIQQSMKICQRDMNNFNTSNKELLFFVIRCLEEPFFELLSYYKSYGSKNWCELPSDTVFNILRFVKEDICCHLVMARTKCSCGCTLEKNYCGILKIGCQVLGLLKQYIHSNRSVSKIFYSELVQWLSNFYEILKEVKAHKCKKWSQIYKELGTYAYNIGTALYSQENVAFLNIYQCFLKYSIEFEGSSPELLKPNLNEVTINVMCEHELKNQNVERCMAFAALYCLIYPAKGNFVNQNWWIRSKMKVKEDSTIQQQTLVSILEKHESLSSIVNPKKYLNNETKVELLTYELLRYRTVWKSKESIMAAFSHLIMIAEVPTIAKVILEIFGDGEILLHENMPDILSKVMKNLQKFCRTSLDGYPKMAMAVLNYYIYKTLSKEMAEQNLMEMEKTMQVIESTKAKFEPIPKDPNDECDIISAYSNLRLSKFTETLKPLNKCLELIASCPTQSYEPQIIQNIVKLLSNIGFNYRLHCFSIKSIQAFELSLKFAQMISDYPAQILAVSFLIENADTKSNFVKEMISQADETAKLLEKDNLKHSETLAIYHISKAKAYLYDEEDLSFKSWKVADALVTANEERHEFKYLRAELYILHYKLTKSCNVLPGEHERHPMTFKLHCAMDIVISQSKNLLSSYELCIMFDTVYELAKAYYLMRLPRDLRAYSKNSVLLTQKIVLPIRCVSFLILLAHSDLLTCKFDHCNVKLNGVNDIFCLSQSRPVFLNERIDNIEADTKIENKVDKCARQIQEMALDLPQHTRQYSPSSPVLMVQAFTAPPFLSHEKCCICFICISFEYHQLLLQKYHLDALYNMYDKDDKMAEDFIYGALRLYKTLERNYDRYKKKAKSLISESLIPNFYDNFREYYGNILYDYSFHLKRKAQESHALKINTELIQLLKPNKFQYIYLYNDALIQRLSYIIPEPKQTSRKMEIDAQLKSVSPREIISLQRTPTNKKTTVKVTINGVPTYSPPKRRVKNKCALFTSPSDSDDAIQKELAQKAVTPKTKTSIKSESESTYTFALPKPKEKRNVSLLGTPLLGDPHTPKISIFQDDKATGSVRKSNRKQLISMKKQVSVEIPEPIDIFNSTHTAQKSVKKVRKILNSTMISDDNGHSSKKNSDEGDSQQLPIIAGPSKLRRKIVNSTMISDENSHSSKKNSDEGNSQQFPIRAGPSKSRSKIVNSTMISDENIHSSKKNSDEGNSQQFPIIAGPSKSRSQLLTQKIKASTIPSKTISNLRKRIADNLLVDKIALPIKNGIVFSSSKTEENSIISDSPEHEIDNTRVKASVEKARLSAKKTNRSERKCKVEPEVKKNLLSEFLDTGSSSSKCTKYTGSIRKSTRNRVL